MFTMSLLPDRFIPFLSKSSKNKSWNPAHTHTLHMRLCIFEHHSNISNVHTQLCLWEGLSFLFRPIACQPLRLYFISSPCCLKNCSTSSIHISFLFSFRRENKKKVIFFRGRIRCGQRTIWSGCCYSHYITSRISRVVVEAHFFYGI